MRDGIVILPADGQPDRVIFQPPGILGAGFPEIPFDDIKAADVLAGPPQTIVRARRGGLPWLTTRLVPSP